MAGVDEQVFEGALPQVIDMIWDGFTRKHILLKESENEQIYTG